MCVGGRMNGVLVGRVPLSWLPIMEEGGRRGAHYPASNGRRNDREVKNTKLCTTKFAIDHESGVAQIPE